MSKKKITFFNTFDPIVPLYRDSFQYFEDHNVIPEAVISAGQYRKNKNIELKSENIRLLWTPKLIKKNKRYCALLYYIQASFLLLSLNTDKVVFLTQPPLFYLVGSWILSFRKIPYIIHVWDLYPDLLQHYGYIGKITNFMLNSLVTSAFVSAEQIIVIGQCMREVIIKKGVSENNVRIVENWTEEYVENYSGNGDSFRKEFNLDRKFVILYSGNMGRFHIFDTLLNVAKRLESYSDIVFVFVGQGVRRSEIQQTINDGGIKNVILLDSQPIESFCEILAAGDVHFVSLRDGFEGLMVPSKFYSILATEKPVIYEGNPMGEVGRVVTNEGCGDVIPTGDTDSLEEIILHYYNNPQDILDKGKKAKLTHKTYYGSKKLAQRYANILNANFI